jgi:hypothetical protein
VVASAASTSEIVSADDTNGDNASEANASGSSATDGDDAPVALEDLDAPFADDAPAVSTDDDGMYIAPLSDPVGGEVLEVLAVSSTPPQAPLPSSHATQYDEAAELLVVVSCTDCTTDEAVEPMRRCDACRDSMSLELLDQLVRCASSCTATRPFEHTVRPPLQQATRAWTW